MDIFQSRVDFSVTCFEGASLTDAYLHTVFRGISTGTGL